MFRLIKLNLIEESRVELFHISLKEVLDSDVFKFSSNLINIAI